MAERRKEMREKLFFGPAFRKQLIFWGILMFVLAVAPLYAQTPLTATATATPTSGPAPLNVTFTATVSGGTSPYTFLWTFGDGQTGTTNPITHIYTTAGSYAVTLVVTDSAATPASVTVNVGTIRVFVNVANGADPQCGLPPLNVCFEGSATGGVAPYSYTWNFGDGAPAYNTHSECPCHGFDSCGVYTTALTVVDAKGNTGQASVPITVFDFSVAPVADTHFGMPDLRVNFSANINFFCGPSFSPIDCSQYTWDFGDGSDETNNCNPQHIYSEVGTYTVTLKVAIDCGGETFEKSGTVDITVVPDPTIYITSPTDYGEWMGPMGTIQSVVYTNSTVSRVDYYIDGSYVGSSSVAPYQITLSICGASGIYELAAIAYTANGGSSVSDPVNVVISNPTLDGTHYILKSPYRVKFFGTGFKPGAKLYVNGIAAPVTKVLGSTTIIAKKGKALKALMPQGVPVLVSLTNKDGGCTNEITFQR